MTSIPTLWYATIVPTLTSYIRIPVKSPHFDPDWAKHGHIDEAVELAARLGSCGGGQHASKGENSGRFKGLILN